MCGITGYVTNNSLPAEREVLQAMNCAIAHRGPDDDGFYIKENVGLAMRRLSIIDLASGKQPIRNADGTKWIVYNGEIYNYQELRRDLEANGHKLYTNSDTEAIVHLYDVYGPECLHFLRGMFALAIWDENDRSLFLARDRVGKKPLLYSHQADGTLIFGSEFQALLKHPAISREVDFEAIDAYLSFLCVPAPKTAFKQIRKLEPGHWLLANARLLDAFQCTVLIAGFAGCALCHYLFLTQRSNGDRALATALRELALDRGRRRGRR